MSHTIIDSGPGTGKTEFMKESIKQHLESGMKSEEILGFTFTSAAARNMKERLANFENLQVQNIHSYCVNILKEQLDLNIVPDDILKYLVDQMVVNKGRFHPENISASKINSVMTTWRTYCFMKTENGTLADYKSYVMDISNITGFIQPEDDKDAVTNIVNRVIHILQMLDSLGYTDFFDVVAYSYFIINNPNIKYILVDEFQDLTYIEYRMITSISPTAEYLFLGDSNQGIYGWRHSSYALNVEHFKQYIGDLNQVQLTDNYRCSEAVLSLSNALTEKQDVKKVDEVGQVSVVHSSDISLKNYLEQEIQKYDEVKTHDTLAILTQSNAEASRIVNDLKENKIKVFHKIRNSYNDFTPTRLSLKILHFMQCAYNTSALISLCLDEYFANKFQRDLISLLKFFRATPLSADLVMYGEDSPLYRDIDCQYVIFDTETTGVDYDKEDIIQIAAVKLDRNLQEIDRLNIYLNTDKDLTESSKVHNITADFLAEHGVEPRIGLEQALDFFKDCILVAHNTRYDAAILLSNCQRYPELLSKFTMEHWMDTLDLARVYLKDTKPANYKLETLITHLGLDATPNHNAMFDVEATVCLFKYILNKTRSMQDKLSLLLSNGTFMYAQEIIQHLKDSGADSLQGILTYTAPLATTVDEQIFQECFVTQINSLLAKGFSIDSILEFFQLRLDFDEAKLYNVTVCTIHQSKGLEFTDVILVQEYSSKESLDNKNAENVAVSRAKRNFTLYIESKCSRSRIEDTILKLNNRAAVQQF